MKRNDIAWNQAKAKEQIYCQFWVESFKNNNEGWANWRRTGYPNESTTIMTFDTVIADDKIQQIPRRKKFNYPKEGVANYTNKKERIDIISADPEFGEIDNEYGRYWWDKQ